MSAYPCVNCGKLNEFRNYCDWACHVDHAKKSGGTMYQPNGLPIACIKNDNSMWEHEHGDHPDYKFPVEVEYCGTDENEFTWAEPDGSKRPMSASERQMFSHQVHALIYTDGHVALTIYECCYAMWYLRDNEVGGGSLWKKGEWRLTAASLDKVKELKTPCI
jgi:hypothetical protein